MSEILSLVMDGVMILLLAGTIFYAVRLSIHIKAFRDSRKDLEKLLTELSSHIEKAEDAVEGLRANAKQSGRDLQAMINEAKGLSEELLEKLAGQSARIVEKQRGPVDFDMQPRTPKRSPARTEDAPLSIFSIRDPEFDEDLDGGMNEEGLMQGDRDDEDRNVPGGFSSQAEKDLYDALRRKKKTEAGGVS
jgi:hypothetical protein